MPAGTVYEHGRAIPDMTSTESTRAGGVMGTVVEAVTRDVGQIDTERGTLHGGRGGGDNSVVVLLYLTVGDVRELSCQIKMVSIPTSAYFAAWFVFWFIPFTICLISSNFIKWEFLCLLYSYCTSILISYF